MFPERLILWLTLCAIATAPAWSQSYTTVKTAGKSALKEWQQANDLIARQQYAQAVEALKELSRKRPDFIDPPLLLGELQLLQGAYAESITSLLQVISLDARYASKAWFFLAQAYWELDSLERCLEACNRFLDFTSTSRERRLEAERMRINAAFAREARQHPVPFAPKPLPSAVNSDWPEYLPSLSGDEQTLVFTRRLGKGAAAQEDFYLSHKINGQWRAAEPIVSLNTPRNEGGQTLTADGKAMYFVRCDQPGGFGSCDIYYAERDADRWSAPQNLGPPVCTPAWETQPSIAADGRTLYFVSNRSGGKGGSDIWISRRDEAGNWSAPENAGDSINTPFDEKSPYIHPDGQTLYFASNGHPGMGGDDLFVSRRHADGSWGRPQNLGYPINSKNDENSLFVALSGKLAYFASGRFSDRNDFNLYVFELYDEARPTPTAYLTGTVVDEASGRPLHARIQLYDLRSGALAASSRSDTWDGRYLISLPAGTDYALHAFADGYLFYSRHFSLSRQATVRPDTLPVRLKPLTPGQSIPLYNIFFDHDSYALKKESEVELQRLLSLLQQNSTLRIRIDGHTDNQGSHEHNQRLSENRAKAVYEYLLAGGIEKSRLSFRGFGEQQPIATNDTEAGRALNRRTEITVLSR
ncbi:MAG: OmpA family protein [Chitinophagales bacterium]|nr:OmpA family protein [Chitinophagales bacterium]MDW8394403.1 OmpA family protein [Chitinophagales bacterium]